VEHRTAVVVLPQQLRPLLLRDSAHLRAASIVRLFFFFFFFPLLSSNTDESGSYVM
jgi:hypothetical protein